MREGGSLDDEFRKELFREELRKKNKGPLSNREFVIKIGNLVYLSFQIVKTKGGIQLPLNCFKKNCEPYNRIVYYRSHQTQR